ncbi:nucleotidyltransferase [Polaribacter sp. 11A2H]|uniref:nucleotidyltransferase n=1 Tax=Polaribacter sp. 11A2H TaxID=2687290 RepID=UPI00140CACD4|nr:nucleotidyltransferase [Polaribacter sp. 11A2H]
MSVLTHLQSTINAVKIAEWERNSIDTSINTLSRKLGNYFNNLNSKFVFGSYDRRTILRRSKDPNSDVDYMVVFNDGANYQPQTLMTRLLTFANANYSRNEIKQSSPTIVIELSSIKFELVPAYESWGNYYIPAPASSYTNWISSNPTGMKTELNNKHNQNNYLIRDLIQLLKYWNVKNGKVYSSYEIERYVLDKWFYSCTNLKDYFYSAVEGLSTYGKSIYNTSKITRLKGIIAQAKIYEQKGMNYYAEIEIQKEI